MSLDQVPVSEIITRGANEGIPIGALGRMTKTSFECVCDTLQDALAHGRITQVPKADWPPTQPRDARLPTIPRSMNPDDIQFEVKKKFRLTPLEAGFLSVLLLNEHVDKSKLHHVVESQRLRRSQRPDADETDPKIVDVIICKLRKKLDPAKFTIETSWGNGYYIGAEVKRAILAEIGASHAQEDRASDSTIHGSGTVGPGSQGDMAGD